MTGRKKRLLIAGVIVAAVGIFLGINHEATRVVWSNLTAKKIKLDESKEWEGGASYEKLPYSEVSENTYLNLYVPDSEEKMPLLVLIHGGGFIFNDCESRQAQFMYRYFRDQGYACASVNYRLAQEEPFPGAVEDVKAAIRFLKANADQYGYDPEKIAVWGESAGGYLCTMAGVTTDEDFHGVKYIGEDEAEKPVTADVDVIVNFYGCEQFGVMDKDFEALGIPRLIRKLACQWVSDGLKELGAADYDSVESFFLRKPFSQCTQEELNQASPFYYIAKNLDENSDKHLLVRHGDADLTVPWLQSQRLYEAMTQTVGEDSAQFTLFSGYKHAADLFYSDENLSQVKAYLDGIFAVQESGFPE